MRAMSFVSVASLLALCAILALPRAAMACSLPDQSWSFLGFGPLDADGAVTVPVDGPLVINGWSDASTPHIELAAGTVVTVVDAAGAPVPGAVVALPAPNDFGWFPDAPLVVGATYRVAAVEQAGVGDWMIEEPSAFVAIAPVAAGAATVLPGALSTYDAELQGECLDDGFASCFGCERRAVVGQERRWRISARYTTGAGLFAAHRGVRAALGADPAEALAIVARTPIAFGANGEGEVVLEGGAVAAWPAAEGCIAVEVHEAGSGLIAQDVFCEPVPGALAADEGGAGCSTTGPAGGGGALWALALLCGLGRRRLGALVLGAALTVVGCGGEGAPEETPCLDVECAGTARALPPLLSNPGAALPISGGTLAVDIERAVAVVADSERDRVQLVDLAAGAVVAEVEAAGEPGRVVIDSARGVAHVALRRGGAVLTVGLDGSGARRHPVCAAPRGLALEGDRLHVACAGGWLWTLDRAGQAVRRVAVAPDLRDVVVAGGFVHVSRFRAPELITLDGEGAIVARRAPPVEDALRVAEPTAPTVAWRTVALDDGRVVMLHQRARLGVVATQAPGGYGASFGASCGGSIVSTALTLFPTDPAAAAVALGVVAQATLAVDLAADGETLALAAPGNAMERQFGSDRSFVVLDDALGARGACLRATTFDTMPMRPEITAVAVGPEGFVALRREPAALIAGGETIALSGPSVFDTGHDLFHKNVGSGIACASCHPEGSEDGHAWLFEGHGLRRTQELRGGIAGSAPFHWTGDMRDFGHLMDEVMTRRMSGPEIPKAWAGALMAWIDGLAVERVDPIEAGDAIAGAAVFADPMVGCAACHSGPRLSDGARYDVGTGGAFETATLLGIGRRGSLMHDGCGLSLADRFDEGCGGGDDHGRTSHLSATELADLVAYLATL
ncbi:MAG: hypothetical protein R3F65_26555 [bacterium]